MQRDLYRLVLERDVEFAQRVLIALIPFFEQRLLENIDSVNGAGNRSPWPDENYGNQTTSFGEAEQEYAHETRGSAMTDLMTLVQAYVDYFNTNIRKEYD